MGVSPAAVEDGGLLQNERTEAPDVPPAVRRRAALRDVLGFYQRHRSTRSDVSLGVAAVFALLFAAGTASLSVIAHWIASPSATIGSPSSHRLVLLAIAAFCSRPLFFVLHVHWVIRSMSMAVADHPDREALRPGGFKGVIRSFTTLTRDPPTIVILMGAMIWMGGLLGFALGGAALAGLLAAKHAQAWARKFYARWAQRQGTSMVRFAGPISDRGGRAFAQASPVLSITLIILVLTAVKLNGSVMPQAITSVVVMMLLLGAPMRRIAQLLGKGGEDRDGDDD